MEYPTADDIHALHEDIVTSDPGTEPGIRNPAAVGSALEYIASGYFGQRPETIHEKAAHLMRLLVADHPYVDGNKRTALTAAATLYYLNGYTFEPDDRIRSFLRGFATDADSVALDELVDYLDERTTSGT